MSSLLLVFALLAAVGVGIATALWLVRRAASAPADMAEVVAQARDEAARLASQHHEALGESFRRAVESLQAQAATERQAVLEQLSHVAREQIGAQVAAGQADLAAKKDVIGTQLDQIKTEMRSELDRLGQVVTTLGERNAHHFGEVDRSLRSHAEVTQHLSATTQSLHQALANSKTRGQWGERMAEDVLRLAGFVENVNYHKQTAVDGDSRAMPDFTFFMPKDHVVYMDVKFPLTSYLRHLEASTEAERNAHRDQFLRDVRLRVKELSKREYARAGDRPSMDQVLLFLPNETLSAFILENDPSIMDDALKQSIVLCSPVTLFAYLGLIRSAFDSFMMEQTSDQILGLLGKFTEQWGKYNDALDTVRRRFDAVQRDFDQLQGTRKRALERPLRELESVRREKGLPVDGALFDLEPAEHSNVHELGA